MAKFCSNCGKQVNEGAAFCDGCGHPINAAQAVNQQYNYQKPQYTYQSQPRSVASQPKILLQRLSDKMKIEGIFLIIMAIIQCILGIIILIQSLDSFDEYSRALQVYPYDHSHGAYQMGRNCLILALIVFVLVGISTFLAVKDFRYSKTVLMKPIGIFKKFYSFGKPIGTLIYGILFGGVIGIAGAIYAFTVRNFVVVNQTQFEQIERDFIQQNR